MKKNPPPSPSVSVRRCTVRKVTSGKQNSKLIIQGEDAIIIIGEQGVHEWLKANKLNETSVVSVTLTVHPPEWVQRSSEQTPKSA